MDLNDVDTPTPHGQEPEPAPRRSRLAWRGWATDAGIAAAASTVCVVLVFRLWDAPLRVPFHYARDSLAVEALVKRIIEGDSVHNLRVGYPFGLDHRDFPTGADNLHLLLIRGIAAVTSDFALVTNLYFLGTFVLVAVAATLVLRAIGVSRALAIAAGLVYAFLPSHFLRSIGHLFLASYYLVPVAALLLLRLDDDHPPLWREPRNDGPTTRFPGHLVLPLVGALAIGSAGVYYAAFFIVLAGGFGTLSAIARRRLRPLASAAALSAVVVGALVVNLAPTFVVAREQGPNPAVAQRTPGEADHYGLRMIQMALPIPGHRIDALGELTGRGLQAPSNSEGMSFLGTTTALAFIGLLGVGLLNLVQAKAQRPRLDGQLAALTIASCLVGATGGFSWVLALAGFTEIRAWNRISVYIAFFAVAAAALWVDRLVGDRSRLRWALALVLVPLALLDQTSPAIVPDARPIVEEFESDRDFFTGVEDALGRGAAVFQVPYLPYPEAALQVRGRMADYDPIRGFLHTDTLRWSYGGMRGREGEWQAALASAPVAEQLELATIVGFDALYVDRYGFDDGGAAFEGEVQQLAGAPLLQRSDGRFVLYDLRPLRRGILDGLGTDAARAERREVLAARP